MHHHQSFDDQTQGSFRNMSHGCGPRSRWHGAGKFGRGAFSQIPVNVRETAESYELYVLAPGRAKSDFKISVSDDVLTVAYQEVEQENDANWLRQEYRRASFERRFLLSDKVDATAISATYNDGILLLTLPKQAGSTAPAQEISVA